MSIEILTPAIPYGYVGQRYQCKLEAKSSWQREVCWLLDENTPLPKGMVLSAEGEISGIPMVSWQESIQIFASAKEPDERVSRLFLLNIYNAKLQIQMPLHCCYEGTVLLEAVGGAPPYVWSADSLPLGMCLEQNCLCGAVDVRGGATPVTLTVTDCNGAKDEKTIFIEIP